MRKAILAALLLAVPVVVMPVAPAGAAPAQVAPADRADATAKLALALQGRLGDRSAGAYHDAAGRLVVTVTDAAAAETVRAAGAEARVVTRSAATLRAATAQLDRTAAVPGTAWQVDPATNQVLVQADSTVTGARKVQLEKAVSALGGAARLETVPGRIAPEIGGGDAIYMGGSRCSMAFAVAIGSVHHFLTAGHCTNLDTNFYANAARTTHIGVRAGTSFPGNDYGLVRATVRPVGDVNMYDGTRRDISSARNAVVGETVGLSGSTSGLRRGRVTGVNVTVNYPQGSVHGLIQTTICSAGGDSGGAVFANNSAIGIHSGSTGGCGGSNRAYHQPVTEALAAYGARIY
ncbi:S1 family peptidase [Polymorphospora sp. NPDC050346]|uniref:S1 family peptidase n=1 Tax=Polymorphospora sp. NPDC050346 TaxID=3155780 RepID=UPI0033CD5CB8